MSTATLIDRYDSTPNPILDHEEYKQKLFEKLQSDQRNGSVSFLNSIEELRNEQRRRLAQTEHDYYNQKPPASNNLPIYRHTIVTTKPPLPKGTRRSVSPVLLTEQRAQHHLHHRPMSENIVRRHDEDTAFCPHRTPIGNMPTTVHDLTSEHVRKQIQSMWNEFELDDYLQEPRTRLSPAAASWAGRITIPEPFALTSSVNTESVHRRKCMPDIEAAKLQKEVEEELSLTHPPFKAKPVPAHVRMPLYEVLQDEQRTRSEQVRQLTKEYLNSIQKPFGFDAREKAKTLIRRHSYSGDDGFRSHRQFKAKPLPSFYARPHQENEGMKEKALYRSVRKEIRAKQLLRQSRLPFSSEQSKHPRRSRSAIDLSRHGNFREYSFRPKTNGYYVPNYDKLHSEFLQTMEEKKRTRSPTKCKPFLLYTNLIPSKKEKILDDIRHDAHVRHSQTFQIKGKQMPTKSASIVSLSSSLQQSEAIPTKGTDAQRLREAVGKKKRREEEGNSRSQDEFQRSQSAKDRRVRERIRDRAKIHDHATVHKAKRDEKARRMRQSMQQSEDDYARKLDEMNERLQNRPLLLEQDSRDKAVRNLEKKFKHAMNIAHVTEDDLLHS